MGVEYFLRLLCPRGIYNYSTKIRMPQNEVDFRKFLIAKYVLKKGGSAIDGGAHIGYYTRCFSDLIQGTGKVYSFEPNPYMFRLLKKYSPFHPNIFVYQKALSNVREKSSFYVEPFSLTQDSSLQKGRAKQKKVSVETVMLDELLNDVQELKLIKLDVEGYERQALIGGEKLIRRDLPWLILEYVQNQIRNDYPVVSLLAGWGYTSLDLRTLKTISEEREVEMTDILAIPKQETDKVFEILSCF